ncbi:MAG: carbohydrate kinase [Thiofilum sp.]|uniref:carbohydrate kinase family protein n=1 Tax=Thiofilum sp. TaxID=2212733 RepID=UPI0025EED159|nr:carbohydrate kinase [Thiofilum sp.]MBK8453048.1 carbohydrate kinase [Thiofilum sp.]
MIVICGEALFDVFKEHHSETLTTFPLLAVAGGSPFNVAIGLARLNTPVALLTGLSNDFLGQRLKSVLEQEQVNTQYLIPKSAPTTLGFIEHGADGVPHYAFYGNGAADRVLTTRDTQINLASVTALHFGSYTTVTEPTADSFLSLAQSAMGKCLISYDPNIRPTVEPNMDIWRNRFMQFSACANLLKISDEDLNLLYPDADPKQKAQEWLARGVDLVLVTRGSKGVWAFNKEHFVEVATPNITVVDTVGAGDTFQAATLYSLQNIQALTSGSLARLARQDLEDICQFAAKAAAITCTRRGADLPRLKEIIAL